MNARSIEIRTVDFRDRKWMEEEKDALFFGETIVTRGRVHRPLELPGFSASADGERTGVVLYEIRGTACEVVFLEALRRGQGIGTELLDAVAGAARAVGCETLWLITTNDNTDALRFYQRRGFCIAAVYPGAIAESRKLKPTIPEVGNLGIPIRDEIRLEKRLPAA